MGPIYSVSTNLQYRALTFGISIAPRVFTILVKMLAHIIRRQFPSYRKKSKGSSGSNRVQGCKYLKEIGADCKSGQIITTALPMLDISGDSIRFESPEVLSTPGQELAVLQDHKSDLSPIHNQKADGYLFGITGVRGWA